MVALKAKKTESIALGQKLRSYAEQNYPPPDIGNASRSFLMHANEQTIILCT